MSAPFVTSNISNYINVLAIHGIMMVVAWLIFGMLGIYTARYLRYLNIWFGLHASFMSIAFVTVSASFVLIVLYRYPSHFYSDLPLNVFTITFRNFYSYFI
jgi:hypothetical protein